MRHDTSTQNAQILVLWFCSFCEIFLPAFCVSVNDVWTDRYVIETILMPHVPVHGYDFFPKAINLGHMARKMILVRMRLDTNTTFKIPMPTPTPTPRPKPMPMPRPKPIPMSDTLSINTILFCCCRRGRCCCCCAVAAVAAAAAAAPVQGAKEPKMIVDKDNYGNKRVELAGTQLVLLFEDAFKTFNSDLKRQAEKVLSKPNRAQAFSIVHFIKRQMDVITNAFIYALSTGNWRMKRFRKDEKGVTETIKREAFIDSLGHITRIRSNVEKTRKISGPRSLHGSQWGLVCPADTPEGDQCGLVKSLALLAHVTTDEDAKPVNKILFALGMEDIQMVPTQELYAKVGR